MDAYTYLGNILSISAEKLLLLEKQMKEKIGKAEVIKKIVEENKNSIKKIKKIFKDGEIIEEALENAILAHEKNIRAYMEKNIEGVNEFEKAVTLALEIGPKNEGFFLKRNRAKEILKKRKPDNLLKFLHLNSVDELFSKYDVAEAFSALRFVESDEWMHKTFDDAYSDFTSQDFEKRAVEIKVLGQEWMEIAKKFVEKKHHNVSHLKEFGVIFLNPIQENIPGKFIRDFALLFHYFNEIHFYSKLFEKFSNNADFAEKLKSLLRGDVPEKKSVERGEWLIIQRYLWKDNPNDERLFLPRINPESVHWARAEKNLTDFGKRNPSLGVAMWSNLNWVGEYSDTKVISYDLEDNAMSAVSRMEGNRERFYYHEREALWTKLFMEYVGGEEEMEKLLIENFMEGRVQF